LINHLEEAMRIDAFLQQSPMFAVNKAARRFESLATEVFAADGLNFLEGLVLAAMYFEAPRPVKPSQLAETFANDAGQCEPLRFVARGHGFFAEKIDPEDARAYQLTLKPLGKKSAVRVIGVSTSCKGSFEREIGKTALGEMLKAIRKLAAPVNWRRSLHNVESRAPERIQTRILENVARHILILHDGSDHLPDIFVVDQEDLLRAGGGRALLIGKRRGRLALDG
jgi:hypothetical protein